LRASRHSFSRSRLRAGDIVHQTIASPAARATRASSKIHSIAASARCAALVACLAAAACTLPGPPPPEAPARYIPATWSELPGFAEDRLHEAWPAFVAGCRALVARPASADIWRRPCAAATLVDANDERAVRAFFAAHFSPWRVAFADGRDTGLVTGYYEARLEGSRERTERFTVPLYAPPADLVAIDVADVHPELRGKRVRGRLDGRRVVSYWTRHDIERGTARLDARPLAWVADPLDAFFLEVQGSGRIALPDGGTLRVGYADQNGHPYRAIGRVLVERGEMALADVSLQSIRAWATRHPDQVRALLDENPSYVFFREIAPPAAGSPEAAIDGPIGSLGVPLLSQRTIAVDPAAIPLGAPIWLATTMPGEGAPIRRLVLAQDTGGAIRGAVRADYYWGFGDDAMRLAGAMREQGRVWLLWPTASALPMAGAPAMTPMRQ
jgi:membrane-bound lytic murein transglycosylase A